MNEWARRALEALLWWGICWGIWLLSLSELAGDEMVMAALCAIPCALLAVAGRIAAEHAYGLRPGWLLPALAFPAAVVSDTVQVLASAVTRRAGRFETIPVSGARGHGALPEGRRAIAGLFITVTPGSFLADIDPDTGEAVVHVLAERGPSMARLAGR